jgi:hypothetical protein
MLYTLRKREEKMSLRRLLSVAVLLLTAGGAVADAREVYLNGVKLDVSARVPPQTFVGCDVRFDEKGDVYITAKGYKIAVTTTPLEPRAAPAPAPTPVGPRGFWLVSKQTQKGAVQYDIDVYINDQLVKRVRSTEDSVVMEVTKYVHGGDNRVRMVAVKNIGDRRTSMSPTDTMEVVVGEGVLANGMVTVDRVHVSFRRSANEERNVQEDFSFKSAL